MAAIALFITFAAKSFAMGSNKKVKM